MKIRRHFSESDLAINFNTKVDNVIYHLSHGKRNVVERLESPIPNSLDSLSPILSDHKDFEDEMKKMESEVFSISQLYHQLSEPSMEQQTKLNQMDWEWKDIWEISRAFAKW